MPKSKQKTGNHYSRFMVIKSYSLGTQYYKFTEKIMSFGCEIEVKLNCFIQHELDNSKIMPNSSKPNLKWQICRMLDNKQEDERQLLARCSTNRQRKTASTCPFHLNIQ